MGEMEKLFLALPAIGNVLEKAAQPAGAVVVLDQFAVHGDPPRLAGIGANDAMLDIVIGAGLDGLAQRTQHLASLRLRRQPQHLVAGKSPRAAAAHVTPFGGGFKRLRSDLPFPASHARERLGVRAQRLAGPKLPLLVPALVHNADQVAQHLQQRRLLVAPGAAPAHRVEADQSGRAPLGNHRQTDQRPNVLLAEQRLLGRPGFIEFGNMLYGHALLVQQQLEEPGNRADGNILEVVNLGTDSLGDPLVRVREALETLVEADQVGAVDFAPAADALQRFRQCCIDPVFVGTEQRLRGVDQQALKPRDVL